MIWTDKYLWEAGTGKNFNGMLPTAKTSFPPLGGGGAGDDADKCIRSLRKEEFLSFRF